MSKQRIASLRALLPPSMVTYYKTPLLIERGQIQYLYDSDGKKYLDMFGGIVTVSVGHCHPRVTEALKQQADKLWHTTSIYHTSPMFEYAEKLTCTLPKHLKVCFFTNSGSEANDLALTLARLHTGRFDVLSLRNSFHGMTQTVMGATNVGSWKHPLPSGFGVLKTTCPDPYRGSWGGTNCRDSLCQPKRQECGCNPGGECQASEEYLKDLQTCLDYDFPKATGPAAFIAESIQGVGGTVQYPRNWLKNAFEAIHQRGGLCISDEVQSGMGRLGTNFWGFQDQNAHPDIMTCAKGIANGFPMGLLVTTEEIAQSLGKALYFNTFGGNPLASVVAKAVLEVIEDENLKANCTLIGNYMLEQLSKLSSPLIGDIRGKGLMLGVELVEECDAATGKAAPPLAAERVARIFEHMKDQGVLVGKGGLWGNTLRIKPPMCINKENADQCIQALELALKQELTHYKNN